MVSLELRLISSIFVCRMISNCHLPRGGSKCTTILSYYMSQKKLLVVVLESSKHDLSVWDMDKTVVVQL